ncbi:hypothetical protein AN237_02200 [Raoultella ornithinolytica]|nr:hypothetical protein AN237_02200 [Raoultella ornithinolytica]
MHLILWFRYYHLFIVSFLVASEVMSKSEIALLVIVIIILLGALWFIFSGEIWTLVCYLESRLYPSIVAPE